ncbi:TPA: SE2200 family small protein [Staphylococcus aureus]
MKKKASIRNVKNLRILKFKKYQERVNQAPNIEY